MNFLIYFSLSIFSKILASGRELGVGYFWGAGAIVDAFIISMMFPMLFIDMANVLFNSTYISVYINNNEKNKKSFFKKVVYFTTIYVLTTAAILYLLIKLYVTYSDTPTETITIINHIVWYVILYYVLMILSEFLKSHLMAIEKQKLMPLPMIFANAIFIAIMYVYSSDNNSATLILCFLMSGMVQFLLYFLLVLKKKKSYTNQLDIVDGSDGFNIFIKTIPPVLFNAAVNQSSKIIDKIIASSLIIGSLSTLYFAQQLYAMYVNIIIVSILTFSYPKICSKIYEDSDFSQYVIDTILLLLAIIVLPMAVGISLSKEIFHIVLPKSSVEDIQLASTLFNVLILSLVFESITATLKRAYWAIGKMKLTVYVSALTVMINIICSVTLSHFYGVRGLVYGYCISTIACSLIFIYLFKNSYKIKITKKHINTILLIIMISIVTYTMLVFLKVKLDDVSSLGSVLLILIISFCLFLICIIKSGMLRILGK